MISRRSFVGTLGAGAAALGSSFISARGREGLGWDAVEETVRADEGRLILSSNENPLGPAPEVVEAVRRALEPGGERAGRYPMVAGELKGLIAGHLGVKPDNIQIGCGSVQILRGATDVYTSRTLPLVTVDPTYEACANYAQALGRPVRRVPVDSGLRIDLDAMRAAAAGSGLVFFCNPNNPTGTVHSGPATADFVAGVLKASPRTTVLVDEAYHHYVTDPSYRTQAALAAQEPRVIVARTFSKVYGMAGLRIGYAVSHPETIKKLTHWDDYGPAGRVNMLALHAAIAAMKLEASYLEKEAARNREARDFTRAFFHEAGYKDTDTQANCVFVDVRQPSEKFQAACQERGVLVGRPFPPFTNHARITIGTMEEMRRALPVFQKVLSTGAARAS